MIASDAAPDIHSPLSLKINLVKPVRIFHKPGMHVPQIDLPMVCERSFISKQNNWKKNYYSATDEVWTDKISHDFLSNFHVALDEVVGGTCEICGSGFR
jgi:hypothetical protein